MSGILSESFSYATIPYLIIFCNVKKLIPSYSLFKNLFAYTIQNL